MSSQENQQEQKEQPANNMSIEVLPEDYAQYDLSFKLIVIGDSGVGKSCLTNKATKNTFEPTYNATIGFEFFSFNIKVNDKVLKLQIWDTCGQELYRSLITNFYRNSSLAIMVYSVNNRESFENIDSWLKELKLHSNPDAKVFLIGNKVDLEGERVITREEGEKYCSDYQLNYFCETSAKTGLNAKNVFIQAAKVLFEDFQKYKDSRSGSLSESSTSYRASLINLENANKNAVNPNNKKCNC